MTYRINIAVPPGDGWVRLPIGKPGRPGLLSALRGSKGNGKNGESGLPGWADATARELLGPGAHPEMLKECTDKLAGLAANARERGVKVACVWIRDSL
jgi:hypothetical protein